MHILFNNAVINDDLADFVCLRRGQRRRHRCQPGLLVQAWSTSPVTWQAFQYEEIVTLTNLSLRPCLVNRQFRRLGPIYSHTAASLSLMSSGEFQKSEIESVRRLAFGVLRQHAVTKDVTIENATTGDLMTRDAMGGFPVWK